MLQFISKYRRQNTFDIDSCSHDHASKLSKLLLMPSYDTIISFFIIILHNICDYGAIFGIEGIIIILQQILMNQSCLLNTNWLKNLYMYLYMREAYRGTLMESI